MDTKVLTAHIPLPLAEKVGAAARRLEPPRAWVIEHALAERIRREEERHRLSPGLR